MFKSLRLLDSVIYRFACTYVAQLFWLDCLDTLVQIEYLVNHKVQKKRGETHLLIMPSRSLVPGYNGASAHHYVPSVNAPRQAQVARNRHFLHS